MTSLKSLEERNVSGEGVARSHAQENLSSCGHPNTGLAVWSWCRVSALASTLARSLSLCCVTQCRVLPSVVDINIICNIEGRKWSQRDTELRSFMFKSPDKGRILVCKWSEKQRIVFSKDMKELLKSEFQ